MMMTTTIKNSAIVTAEMYIFDRCDVCLGTVSTFLGAQLQLASCKILASKLSKSCEGYKVRVHQTRAYQRLD